MTEPRIVCPGCFPLLVARGLARAGDECAACLAEEAALCEMTDEQLTLHLARNGYSPLDVERGLERAKKLFDEDLPA